LTGSTGLAISAGLTISGSTGFTVSAGTTTGFCDLSPLFQQPETKIEIETKITKIKFRIKILT
jgi:hypothetical protein